MTRTWARRGEQLAVLFIIAGIAGMVQPFTVQLLAYGFVLALLGMILFTVASHM